MYFLLHVLLFNRLENIFLSFGDSPEYDLSSECGDLFAMVSEDHQNIGKYSHVLLDWVQRWDPDTKDLVIMVEGTRNCFIYLNQICVTFI